METLRSTGGQFLGHIGMGVNLAKRLWLTASLSALLVACSPHREPHRPTVVRRLSPALEVLERYQVEAYRNQSWCKNMVYSRGRFSNNSEQSTCNLFLGQARPFDTQAETDFETVSAQLSATRLLYITEATYDTDGQLSYAEFHLSGKPVRSAYIYSPGYDTLPEGLTNEIEYTPINEDWYYQWMDWN